MPVSENGKIVKTKRDSQGVSKSQLLIKELSNVKLRKNDNSLDLKTKLENRKRLNDIQNKRTKARSQTKQTTLQFKCSEGTPKDYSWSSKFSNQIFGFQGLSYKGMFNE